jgi:hypothetical protein
VVAPFERIHLRPAAVRHLGVEQIRHAAPDRLRRTAVAPVRGAQQEAQLVGGRIVVDRRREVPVGRLRREALSARPDTASESPPPWPSRRSASDRKRSRRPDGERRPSGTTPRSCWRTARSRDPPAPERALRSHFRDAPRPTRHDPARAAHPSARDSAPTRFAPWRRAPRAAACRRAERCRAPPLVRRRAPEPRGWARHSPPARARASMLVGRRSCHRHDPSMRGPGAIIWPAPAGRTRWPR